ncbi:geranylgeranylglyceryl/heptaprenylglyceryl phosphate synthase [Candidatus Bathyarchaeota archaeon]|nr:MAG: geranylgeranylglyceryl/heptaprenylglyceryl phosphate synthase [Candidatus Bathyarchaeota archaeon]
MGPVEASLLSAIKERGCIHLSLIDPEKFPGRLSKSLEDLESWGTAAIMVGGSTLDGTVKKIKELTDLPVILFPNGPAGVSRFADAIFFMSLLNSSSPRFLILAQAKGAPSVKRFKLEPIPLGYLVVGDSKTAVSSVGRANRIPYSKPELAAAYALAAQYLGMRFVYLEAGSGAEHPVDTSMVEKVSSDLTIPVIVGGGIRTPDQARALAKAGASAIVTGTLLEQQGPGPVKSIVSAMRRA